MKLVGFGCSFTYGSELLDPKLEDSWDRHHENTPYREQNTWLGKLATTLNCGAINLAEPSASNFCIQEKFAEYVQQNNCADMIICIGWTNHLRTSWWSDERQRWVHDGFIRYNEEKLFKGSFQEWLTLSYLRCEQATLNAKLFVNSVCGNQKIRFIQFDALPNVKTHHDNFHQQGRHMQEVLREEGQRLDKTFLAEGGHPNEAGHEYYAKLLHAWMRAKKIV